MWRKTPAWKKWTIGFIIVASILAWCGLLATKGRFHEDEVYTISSSVSPIWEELLVTHTEDDIPLVKTREDYERYSTFSGLNLPLVYDNQWRDVHPPLYYILLHLLMAVMPGATLQAGYVLNILFFLGIDFLALALLWRLGRPKAQIPALILLNLSIITVSSIALQRMYVVAAFFVLATLYQVVAMVQNHMHLSGKRAILLGATILGGFLTQYFYVLFVIPLFIMVVVKAGKGALSGRQPAKKVSTKARKAKPKSAKAPSFFARVGAACATLWRESGLRNFILAHFGAAVFGLALYPIAIEHIFFSYRGMGALAETASTSRFAELFSSDHYGYTVAIFCLGLVAALYIWLEHRTAKSSKNPSNTFIATLLTVPALFYLVFVLLASPYIDLRYYIPALPVAILWLALVLDHLFAKFHQGQLISVGAAALLSCASFFVFPWEYLYRDYHPVLQLAGEHSDSMMVYITHYNFNAIQNLREYLIYKQSVIVENEQTQIDHLLEILDDYDGDEIVLRIDNWLDNGEALIKAITYSGWELTHDAASWPYPAYVLQRVK